MNLLAGEALAASKFKDVPNSYYAINEISSLVQKGVIKGFADDTFRPEQPVTRAEFATFVARALNLPAADSNFKDVPKNSSLYDGISRAAKVGIIKGFADGNFKGYVGVSREDMAVMLDRAMKYKGSYPKTSTLSFQDTKSIGAYAVNSVKKMTAYGIMEDYKGSKKFSGKTVGTRAETARFIYRTLNVIEDSFYGGGNSSDLTIEQIKKKAPLDLTLDEIKKAYGKYEIVERWDQFGKVEGFKTRDVWKQYFDEIHRIDWRKLGTTPLRPDAWLKRELDPQNGFLPNLSAEYISNYPKYEIISVNGVPYFESELYVNPYKSYIEKNFYNFIPKTPTAAGQFKIDIHINKKDFAVYYKGKADIASVKTLSYVKDNKALMIDVESVFKNIPGVTVTANSIKYGSKTVSFNVGSDTITVKGPSSIPELGELKRNRTLPVSVEGKDGQVMVPIDLISEVFNAIVYSEKVNRLEITNYEG